MADPYLILHPQGDSRFGLGDSPFDLGNPPSGLGDPPSGLGDPPSGLGDSPFGLGDSPFGLGDPPFGLGDSPFGLGDSLFGLGDSPFGLGDPFLYFISSEAGIGRFSLFRLQTQNKQSLAARSIRSSFEAVRPIEIFFISSPPEGSTQRQDDPQARSRSDWREFCHNGAKLMTKGAVGVDLDVRFLTFLPGPLPDSMLSCTSQSLKTSQKLLNQK